MGKVDITLFTKKIGKDLFVLQIYVDDIIFGSTNQDFCEEFENMMPSELEMSMIGELSYFLGLQIKQLNNGTFVSQGKYIKVMLKKFGMEDAKGIRTPMGTNGHLDSDASGNMVDQKMYRSMIKSLTERLLNIHKLIYVPIEKCTFHIHLVQLDVVGTSIG
jgi:hypothetical protein